MKIVFIYRGDPRHRTANRVSMFQNIAAAKRLGHKVTLLIPREGMTPAEAQQESEKALADFGITETIPVKTIPRPAIKGRLRRSFDLFSACWALAGHFDLVWSREFHAADYATAFGLSTIIEHHHPFTPRQWKVAARMLERESFKGVAAISGVHERMLVSAGWPEEKVIVAHSGVDISRFVETDARFDLRARLARPGQPIVLYAGSLYSGKGCYQIIQAAARLKDVKFVCVGGRDTEVDDFRKQVETLGLTNIEFTGPVPHAQVPNYLSAADILIAPFTTEGRDIAGKIIIPFSSPIKLFEYMASGKPIIVSEIGAIPEVIVHEKNGLLVTPGDVGELAGAISRLLDDPALAARLGAAARNDARMYTWSERVARVLEFAFSKNPRAQAGNESTEEQCLAPVWKLRRGA